MTCDIPVDFLVELLKNEIITKPYNDSTIKGINVCFGHLCIHGYLNNAKRVWEKWSEYIKVQENDNKLLAAICEADQFNTAKWLWSTCIEKKVPIDISTRYYQAFHNACENWNPEMADWLLNIYTMDVTKLSNTILGIETMFQRCCMKHKFRLAKLLGKRYHTKILMHIDDIFKDICKHSNLDVIKWVWNIYYIELYRSNKGLMTYIDGIFDLCCQRSNIEIIDWFCGLSNDYWYKKDAANRVVDWYKK